MPPPRLLLFEPNSGGHRAPYVSYVLQAWHELGVDGHLTAAVSPLLFEEHPDLRTRPQREGWDRVSFLEMPEAPALRSVGLLRKGIGERRLLRRLVEQYRPEQVMSMYMDHTQFVLATATRFSYPVPLSGLFLRVSHHRASDDRLPLRQRLTELRKRWLLQAALHNPHAGVFFSADPSVIPALRALKPDAHAALLPDPVPLPPATLDAGAVRQAYGVEPDRRVLLLFGMLAERKGVLQAVEAVRRLPDDDARRVCLVLAGPVGADLAGRLPDALHRLRTERPVQVVLRDAYLHESDILDLMVLADLVLVPYFDHPGTSSVLIRAAGAGTPVLCQDFGLMKEQVRSHALGQLAQSRDPDSIAAGIAQFLDAPHTGFDAERARAFAATQTPRAFAETMFEHLGLL